jgi:hypothetical protein
LRSSRRLLCTADARDDLSLSRDGGGSGFQGLRGGTGVFQRPGGVRPFLGQGDQQPFGGDECIACRLGTGLGLGQHPRRFRFHIKLSTAAIDLGQLVEQLEVVRVRCTLRLCCRCHAVPSYWKRTVKPLPWRPQKITKGRPLDRPGTAPYL